MKCQRRIGSEDVLKKKSGKKKRKNLEKFTARVAMGKISELLGSNSMKYIDVLF